MITLNDGLAISINYLISLIQMQNTTMVMTLVSLHLLMVNMRSVHYSFYALPKWTSIPMVTLTKCRLKLRVLLARLIAQLIITSIQR